MIDRFELRRIAREHLKDAEALLAAQRFEGASYLGGYVVELALKARICKTLKWAGFPETPKEFQGYQSLKVHDLDILLSLSGVEPIVMTKYFTEWSAVAGWTPEARYKGRGKVTRANAELLVKAAGNLLRKI
jgi:hypothetical protein